jgi:hypothetical protein
LRSELAREWRIDKEEIVGAASLDIAAKADHWEQGLHSKMLNVQTRVP